MYTPDSPNRLAIIDGRFMHKVSKALGTNIDYALFRRWLNDQGFNVLWYYNSVVYRGDSDDQGIMKLYDYLATNGYQIKIAEYYDDEIQRTPEVEMTIKAIKGMQLYPDIMLVTVGSAMLSVIEEIHNSSACKVTLTSLWKNQAGLPSSTLAMKKAAWATHDFVDLIDHIKQRS